MSASPIRVSVLLAAMAIPSEQAPAIARFLDSDAGQRWSAIRRQAWPRSRARLRALWQELVAAGLAVDPEPVDLVLPKATWPTGR